MSIFDIDTFEDAKKQVCDSCGALVDKWINIVPGGDFCANCAQTMMRRLFEDLIEYHNGRNSSHISLLNIMYHGDKHRSKVLNLPLPPIGSPFSQQVIDNAKDVILPTQSPITQPITDSSYLMKENQKLRNAMDDLRDDINRLNATYRLKKINEERTVKTGVLK